MVALTNGLVLNMIKKIRGNLQHAYFVLKAVLLISVLDIIYMVH